MPSSPTPTSQKGLAYGVGAYFMWGFLPLYFPLLVPAGPFAISAHRVVWSFVLCIILLAILGQLSEFTALMRSRERLPRLTAASLVLSVNWLVFAIAVLTGHVVDASLGYFLNPIVTVVFAVVFLRERINPLQWVALGIAASGLTVISIEHGSVPWISFALALAFGSYGLIKKQISGDVPALAGHAVETAVLLPLAVGFLIVIQILGVGTFGIAQGPVGGRWGHVLLMMFTGVATAVPLLLFNGATRRLPLVMIGMLQFIVPIMQFLTGVYIQGEEMSPGRWIGFFGVWAALIVLTIDAVHKSRRRPAPARDPRPSS